MHRSTYTLRRLLVATLIIPALVAIAQPALGQTFSAAAMGMGAAYSAMARDYEAALLNPANLSLAGNASWSLNLISFSGEADNSSLSYDDFRRYSGATLTEEDKARILGLIDGDQLTFDLATDLSALSATAHGFAITVANVGYASGGLPRDLIELMLYGNELGRVYQIADATGEGMTVSSLGLSASRALRLQWMRPFLDEFAVGATYRYLHGWYYGRITEAHGTLETNMTGVYGTGMVTTRTATQGSGAALDFGVAARRGPLRLSLSFHDLASRLTWEDGEEIITTFTADSLTAEQMENEGGDLVDQDDETVDIGSFEVEVPSSVRLGAAHSLGSWQVAGEYVQAWGGDGLTPEAGEFSVGVEHRTTGWCVLRTGFTAGAERTPAISLGAGMRVASMRFDLALSSHGGLLPAQDEGIGVAIGMGLVFH